MSRLVSALAAVLVAVLADAPDASARSNILSAWQSAYPSSGSDDAQCQLCHRDDNGGDPYNAYGWAIRENEGLGYPAAFIAIEGLDSDLDPTGSTNLQEILAHVQPGWTDGANNTIYFKNGSTSTNQAPPAELAALLLDPPSAECDDGADNDGDGLTDLADPGCDGSGDLSEQSPLLVCDDGADNDNDTLTDLDDPGCRDPEWAYEDPECDDGEDNDGDGGVDWDGTPPDANCVNKPWRNRERPSGGCGLGFELALLLPAFWLLRRKR